MSGWLRMMSNLLRSPRAVPGDRRLPAGVALAAVALVLPLSAATPAASALTAVPLATRVTGPAHEPRFTALSPDQTGITQVNTYDDPRMWAELFREFTLGAVGTGVTIGDYDADGRPDVLVVNKTSPCRLYRQVREFVFEDVTERAGLVPPDPRTWNTGATFADVNGDGRLDLYICRFDAPNLLFLNQGNGTFIEAAAAAGVAVKDASVMASFADYDRDGDLDFYLQTNILSYAANFKGRPDYLFRNNGDGTFADVTQPAGIWGLTQGHSAVWWDLDDDGWPDLYVANDFENPDRLYRNNRDGTFTDVSEAVLPHTSYSSMGSDLGDINNDGRTDFFVSDMAATTHYKDHIGIEEMGRGIWEGEMARALCPQYPFNALYLNTGASRFLEIAHLAGLRATDWTWSARFADLDNDGWIDLHVCTGMIRDFMDADLLDKQNVAATLAQRTAVYAKAPVRAEPNLAYRNRGDLRFEEVGREWGLDHHGVSFGAAFADLDRDGDLDLVVSNHEAPPTVYRNNSGTGRGLLIRLIGRESNRWGVGAVVRVETDAGIQVRQHTLARGIASSDEPLVHFGLGEQAHVRRLTVAWPSGREQVFADVGTDQFLTITEPDSGATSPAQPAAGSGSTAEARRPLFREVSREVGLVYTHEETEVNEFTRQILLPRRLSGFGPGIAVGDFAGNGRPAVVLPGAVFLGTETGFRRAPAPGSTALAPLLLESNGDGQVDLFVAQGGVAKSSGDPALADRVYWGRGDGTFLPAPDTALPAGRDSTGPVVAADFDGDGDLDVFAGGRVVPGKYPEVPTSRLLRNDGGHFVDVTDEWAPGLREVGLVTSAVWSDANDDHRPDLLLTLEWGPVMLWRNSGSVLENVTAEVGLAERTGWWTSIAAADLNGDGRMDYVVGNLGLNTKYRASPEQPAVLFAGDLDGSGRPNLVEARWEGGRLYPIRGRSKSAYAMPFIRRKFRTFDAWARASVEEIYGEERLTAARRLEATELASGVLLNRGDRFEFRALPTLAQVAPIYGLGLQDFDGDGLVDLAIAQNFYGPEPKTGRFDGGLSLVLLGDGRGGFNAMDPADSGILVPGDAKALAVLDLHGRGRPDLLISQNAGPLLAFEHAGIDGREFFSVALQGAAGNPDAVGGRIAVRYRDGRVEGREIAAGSGHLSQSAPYAFFGYAQANPPVEITARWPDGVTGRRTWRDVDGPRIRLSREEAPAPAVAITQSPR
jgi:enediyne biosynthesis protein E4